MNKVYEEGKDSAWVAAEYDKKAFEIAKIHGQLKEIKDQTDYIDSITYDNADVTMCLNQALADLGEALSACVVYANVYKQEAESTDEA